MKNLIKIVVLTLCHLIAILFAFRIYLAIPKIIDRNDSPYKNAVIEHYYCQPIFNTATDYYEIYVNDSLIDRRENYKNKLEVRNRIIATKWYKDSINIVVEYSFDGYEHIDTVTYIFEINKPIQKRSETYNEKLERLYGK